MRQSGLFGLSDHMKRLSAEGDPLEALARVVDFEAFRPTLLAALAYSDGTKGGRPPYDPVVMLKVLLLAAQNNVSNARMTNSGVQHAPADLQRDAGSDGITASKSTGKPRKYNNIEGKKPALR